MPPGVLNRRRSVRGWLTPAVARHTWKSRRPRPVSIRIAGRCPLPVAASCRSPALWFNAI